MPSLLQAPRANDASLDFAAYLRAPKLSASHGLALARNIANAAPSDLAPHERTALDAILAAADATQAALAARDVSPERTVRPRFDAFANAWVAFHTILRALARLPLPRAHDAQTLLDALLPNGTTFVRFDAPAAWGAAHQRLTLLAEGDRRARSIDVVGEDVVAHVETCTHALSDAVGAGPRRRAHVDPRALDKCVRALSEAITAYCRALAGSCDLGSASSVARFREAVAPLDRYRAFRARAQSARRSGSAPDDAPSPADVTGASDGSNAAEDAPMRPT